MNIQFRFALSFILCLVFLSGAAQCDPKTGTARPGTVEYALSPFKNRTTDPKSEDIDHSITLNKMLTPGNDVTRFTNSDAAEIEGYVILVKYAGKESCNCNRLSKKYRDIHIEIAKASNETDKSKVVVVEITPKIRTNKGDAWSYENVRKLKGQLVKFKGWMMFDEKHKGTAKNTGSGTTIHRNTAWEVHPVTAFTKVN